MYPLQPFVATQPLGLMVRICINKSCWLVSEDFGCHYPNIAIKNFQLTTKIKFMRFLTMSHNGKAVKDKFDSNNSCVCKK